MTNALAAMRQTLTPDERARYDALLTHGDVQYAASRVDAAACYHTEALLASLACLLSAHVGMERYMLKVAQRVEEIGRETSAAAAALKEFR